MQPFLKANSWSIHWQRVPSGLRRLVNFHPGDQQEQKALQAIANVGLIGVRQLERIYGITDYRQKQMMKGQKIIRHLIKSDNLDIPLVTLHHNGALIAGISENDFRINYWVEYRVDDALKRYIFFELFDKMRKKFAIEVTAQPSPFTGGFLFEDGEVMSVYVAKGNMNDLVTHFKWSDAAKNQITLIVCETVNQLEASKHFLADCRVRILLEKDLFSDEPIENCFYSLTKELSFSLAN